MTNLDCALATLPADVGRDFGLSRAMRCDQSRVDHCHNTAYRESDLDRPVMVVESLAMLMA